MLLEAVYEQDFLNCSYGFRPKRSAHEALNTLRNRVMRARGGWVLEVDIERFFDTLDHTRLREILRQRVRDGVLLRLIGKWLNAGVLENEEVSYPEAGTPQGGVISPLLANVYLHEVLDGWFERDVKARLRGEALLCRYADDAVMLFSDEHDARRVMTVLAKRFAKYGLTLHPKKTRLVQFRRPPLGRPRAGDREILPGSFDLLGFTHHWARSRNGNWVVKLRTARDRFSRALKKVSSWCRHHRHEPVSEQWQTLVRKLTGHYAYFGITGNCDALDRFLAKVRDTWQRWLDRRSNRSRVSWDNMSRLLERYPLPRPRIMRAFTTST